MVAQVVGLPFDAMCGLGYGEHWPLKDGERRELGAAVSACLDTLPEKRRAAMLRLLNGYGPWVSLAFTTYALVMPRYAITLALSAAAKASREEQARLLVEGQPVPPPQMAVGDLAAMAAMFAAPPAPPAAPDTEG